MVVFVSYSVTFVLRELYQMCTNKQQYVFNSYKHMQFLTCSAVFLCVFF